MLDRIDIYIEVPRVDYEKMSGDRVGEASAAIRARVQSVRDIQNERFSKTAHLTSFVMPIRESGEIRQFCKLQDEGVALSLSKCQSLMRAAMDQMNLSARAYHLT